jgi:hypothetical protein
MRDKVYANSNISSNIYRNYGGLSSREVASLIYAMLGIGKKLINLEGFNQSEDVAWDLPI